MFVSTTAFVLAASLGDALLTPGALKERLGLLGEWRAVYSEVSGKRGRDNTWVFTLNRFRLMNGRVVDLEYFYRLDPRSRPGWLNLGIRSHYLSDERSTIRGIYRLEGDILTISYPAVGAPRPAEFDPGPHTKNVLIIMRRKRPEDDPKPVSPSPAAAAPSDGRADPQARDLPPNWWGPIAVGGGVLVGWFGRRWLHETRR